MRKPLKALVAFDNLKRRGSELALPRLKEQGIEFLHGDVRCKDDLLEIDNVDLILDCSAEPSVLAGVGGSPSYVIDTNLTGTINCLELARRSNADVIFLSTSRIYPIAPLSEANLVESSSRLSFSDNQSVKGLSSQGVSEEFPLEGARSLYGATKLASELLLTEYIESYKIRGVTNRCGVLTGPWQMGKVDQGVIVLWAAKHFFNKKLAYIGYGGTGKQVRDILHIEDLYRLLQKQIPALDDISGGVFNIGGGVDCSVSLLELTQLCQEFTGNSIPIDSVPETRPNDLPVYISDCRKAQDRFAWQAEINAAEILEEICSWIQDNKLALEPLLA